MSSRVAAMLLVVVTASGCGKRVTEQEVERDAAGAPSAPLTASANVTPSEERPPAVGPSAPEATTTLQESTPVTLEGTYGAPEELMRKDDDETACTDAVKLDGPVHVVDEKGKTARDGRGLGAHPVLGDTSRICVWHWVGKDETGAPMIPWGSHVVLRGTLWTPMVTQHPRALLLFDAVVASATPPPTPAPPDALPEGDSVVLVRTVDAATRTLGVDLVYLYYGDAARRMAAARAYAMPEQQRWFIVNDSPQLRTVVLDEPSPTTVSPKRLVTANGGGWVTVPIEALNEEPLMPYIVGISKGKVTKLEQINLPR